MNATVIAVTVLALALAGCAKRLDAPVASTSASAPEPAAESSAPAPSAPPSPPAPAPEPASVPPAAFVPNEALKDVHFGSGKRDVLGADRAVLHSVVEWLKANPSWLLLIEGHTDERGSWQQNLIVSEARAQAVMRVLVARGIDAARITVVAFGADRPICKDPTERCRARNRRVHFQVRPR